MDIPILSSLILLPTIGAIFIFFSKSNVEKYNSSKYIALFISTANFILSLYLWFVFDNSISEFQFVENRKWIAGLVNYKVGIDGISILFIILTTFITPLCVISVNTTVKKRLKDFLISILLLETLMIGVFCSLDLVVFYLFFEGGLIPMFLIIGIWGGERRVYSAFKFFLFTLLGSVLMLVAIITIYWLTGTTDVEALYEIGIDTKYQNLLWLAFLSSFAVKTPMWPVHTWLPDAHVEAPTGGSIILAAIMLKLGAYGFLRFSLPITPDASQYFSPIMIGISLVAVIYIGLVALVQKDMKKLVAYSSVAHMGFVSLGFFLFSNLGVNGGIVQMISHGFISGAMFFCIGVLYDRMHSREISDYGGVANKMPIFSAFFVFFAMSNAGLPGTSGFVGEFFVILAALERDFWLGFLSALTLILGAAYSLWLVKRVIFGAVQNKNVDNLSDLNKREFFLMVLLSLFVLIIGLKPDLITTKMDVSVGRLIDQMEFGKDFSKVRPIESTNANEIFQTNLLPGTTE